MITTILSNLSTALVVGILAIGCKLKTEPTSRILTSKDIGSSTVIPTIDTAITDKHTVIWCSTMQLAWRELQENVIKQPIRVDGAEEVSQRFNNSVVSKADIAEGGYYVAAGCVKDGIVERISKELHNRFPFALEPKLVALPDALITYSYLEAEVNFRLSYFSSDEGLTFKDKCNNKVVVRSFGILPKHKYAHFDLRRQVDVLFCSPEMDEFAVDLWRDSAPNQIVIAYTNIRNTLEESISHIENKVSAYESDLKDFGPTDVLIVPEIGFHLVHQFEEIMGKHRLLLNEGYTGMWIDQAIQEIKFRLGPKGAKLGSQASIVTGRSPKYYVFDKPFLVYMKKRGASRPYFAMWVGTTELLLRK